jgi:hypothetical protein
MRSNWTGRPPYLLIVADNGAVNHYGSRIRNTALAPSLALVMDRVACLHNKGIGNKPWRRNDGADDRSIESNDLRHDYVYAQE